MTAPVIAPTKNPFDEFIALYQFDPTSFVEDVLGMDSSDWELGPDAMTVIDPEQRQILEWVGLGRRRIAVKSGHGVGKTTTLAWILVWAICCRFPLKAVVTAPTSGQLFDALAAETVTWLKKLPPALFELFDIKEGEIALKSAPEEAFIRFKTSRPETPEALAGVHSPGLVLLIGDEASGIPEPVYEAASGSMSGHTAITILAGNPVRTQGLFFDAFNKLKDIFERITISCVGHRRISPDYVADMARRYGPDSNAFRVRVLGEFPLLQEDRVIPWGWMNDSLKRVVEPILTVKPVWGVDVAGAGQDKSALAKRRGKVLMEKVKTWAGLTTMQLVGRIKAEWDMTPIPDRPDEILIDSIGMGAGVVSRLQELNLPARGINVSELPAMTDLYRNLKAELWFLCRAWFEPQDCSLAEDDELGEELAAVGFDTPESTGKIIIESKAELKKRMPSPDRADAFVLTFAGSAAAALYGENAKSWREPLKRTIAGIV